ncbi:MAG: hypothetical protein PHU93_00150 [Candidatus Gracilibacteria bacterium]|nr:hypothetical protein [Candidatus Gracilibacteria bacterium]
MPAEKTAFEQELTALFIEAEKTPKGGLQSAIQYVAKEKLAQMRSIGEIFTLKSQISEIMEISKEAERAIMLELGTGDEVGRYDFIFDFTKKDHKTAFLSLYEPVVQLLKLRYLHSAETGDTLTKLLEKGFSGDLPIQIKIEVDVQNAKRKRIQNIRIFQIPPPTEEKKSNTNTRSNLA